MGETFTIQISSNLVNQLAGDGDKLKKKTRKPKPKIPREPKSSPPKVTQKPTDDDSEMFKTHTAAGWPLQPPLFLPLPPSQQPENAELDAIRSVLDDSKKVLERLEKQEDTMLQEVTQRAKDLHDKEFKLPDQKPMACLDEKDACVKCYKENEKDPLKCANLVRQFADCARRFRQQAGITHK